MNGDAQARPRDAQAPPGARGWRNLCGAQNRTRDSDYEALSFERRARPWPVSRLRQWLDAEHPLSPQPGPEHDARATDCRPPAGTPVQVASHRWRDASPDGWHGRY